jgi:hypothetical protein
MAYDGGNSTVVLFGGYSGSAPLNDTWTLNSTGSTWTNAAPATSPGTRYGTSTAYETSNNVLLFGGYQSGTNTYFNDTWLWNGITWAQQVTLTSPPARYGHYMAWDTTHSRLVLFGGISTITGTLLNDTWLWNGTSWAQQAPALSPSARAGGGCAYNSQNNLVTIFGGSTSGPTPVNEMWTWNGGTLTWVQVTPGTLPSARGGCGMCAGTTGATALYVFGGSNAFGQPLNDLWIYNGTTWAVQSPSTLPAARSAPVMVFDTALTAPVIFGGATASADLNDAWEYNGTNWVQLSTTTAPGGRYGAMATYDPAVTAVVLFGGYNAGGLNDTWLLTGSSIPSVMKLTTCTPLTAPYLGIPITQSATPQTIVLSAYFQPTPQATPTIRSFQTVLDWYGANGVLISSSTGTAVAEVYGAWTRAYVAATPPAGAMTYGRTVQSTTALSGDQHYMSAVQSEINTQATPGPTSWEPPRDIKINLIPLRQNLIADPAGLGGGFGWTIANGAFVPSSSASFFWPATTTSGYQLTANSTSAMVFQTKVPANPNVAYTFSTYLRPATTARTVTMIAQFYSATNVFLGQATPVVANEVLGQFTRMSVVSAVAPVGTTSCTLQISIAAPVNSEVHYVGGNLMEPLDYLRPYFDANFAPYTDYTWEGTPNQSISDYYPNLVSILTRLESALPDYIPIGSTFSLITGAAALSDSGLLG